MATASPYQSRDGLRPSAMDRAERVRVVATQLFQTANGPAANLNAQTEQIKREYEAQAIASIDQEAA